MKNAKRYPLYKVAAWAMTALVLVTGCKKEEYEEAPEEYANSVTGVLRPDPAYSMFMSALSKVELTRALNDAGPFTLFAPANTAFQAAGITNQTIDTVKTFTGKEYLMKILTYHMLGGLSLQNLTDTDSTKSNYATLNGNQFLVSSSSKGIIVNTVKATATKSALNGVTYTIDKVIPVPTNHVLQMLSADARFTIFVQHLKTFGLNADLENGALGTGVFAPTNDAFTNAGVTIKYVDDLFADRKKYQDQIAASTAEETEYKADSAAASGDPVQSAIVAEQLKTVRAKIKTQNGQLTATQASLDAVKSTLQYHLTPRVYFSENGNAGNVRTVLGKTKTIKVNVGTGVTLTDAKGNTAAITQADLLATNGVIHVIDKVLMP